MTGDQDQIVAVLVKYALRQPLDKEEAYILEQWRSRSEAHSALPDQLRNRRWVEEQRKQLHEAPTAEMWAAIRDHIDQAGEPAPVNVLPAKRRIGYRWASVAAVIMLLVLIGNWQWGRIAEQRRLRVVAAATASQAYKVLLTREDGSIIALDTVTKGKVIVKAGNIQLRKADSNSYIYEDLAPGHAANWARHRLAIAPGSGI